MCTRLWDSLEVADEKVLRMWMLIEYVKSLYVKNVLKLVNLAVRLDCIN